VSRILFTAGLFIEDRPHRWGFVVELFNHMARTMSTLGTECLVLFNPEIGVSNPDTVSIHRCATPEALRDIISHFKPDHLFIWNGGSPGDLKVKEIAKGLGMDSFFHGELGWFPQAGNMYFDKMGVNAASSFNVMEFFPLTDEEDRELSIYGRFFAQNNGIMKDVAPGLQAFSRRFDHHLIALQDERDTNMINSRFNSMAEFVEEAVKNIGELYGRKGEVPLPILVRPHPHQQDVALPDLDFTIDRGDLYRSIMSSYSVHSINSTVLLESAMLGVSVVPYCDGIMRRGIRPHEVRPLLYQLIKRQLRGNDAMNPDVLRAYPLFQEIFNE